MSRTRFFAPSVPALRLPLTLLVLLLAGGQIEPAHGAEIIFVKVLVDEEEVTKAAVWKKRLTDRVHAASELVARYADIRFVVRDYGTWQSDSRIQQFSKSLSEFEQEVDPGQNRLAIGFSSQYRFQKGRNHLGGTRGPLRNHILIRENAPSVMEAERMEVLLHELGHFLGAAHSTSPDSVMRPVVGDGKARVKSFNVGFDKDNAAIINLVGREIRDHRIKRFEQISPGTLSRLDFHYRKLLRDFPEDRTAARYVSVVDQLLKIHAQYQSQPFQ